MVVWFLASAWGGCCHHRRSASLCGNQSVLCGQFPCEAWVHRTGDAGRGVSSGHRRRSTLCRPGPLWTQADQDRLVRIGIASADAQLFRAGRHGAARSLGDRQSVLQDVSRDVAAADGRIGDCRDRDREPGGHHRCVLADIPGDPARLASTACDPAPSGSISAKFTFRASIPRCS